MNVQSTAAWRRYLRRKAGLTSPSAVSTSMTMGSSKQSPNASDIENRKSKYSSPLIIGSIDAVWKSRSHRSASGITPKYATDTPPTNSSAAPIVTGATSCFS